MTSDKKQKAEARALARDAGISYAAARRRLREVNASEVPERDPNELVGAGLQACCDGLVGDPIKTPEEGWAADLYELDLPRQLEDPVVVELVLDLGTIDLHVEEEYEGVMQACDGTVQGVLVVGGYLPKGDAYALEGHDDVTVTDPDWNRHYASVETRCGVGVEFQAMVDVAAESVEDLEISAVTQHGLGGREHRPRRPGSLAAMGESPHLASSEPDIRKPYLERMWRDSSRR